MPSRPASPIVATAAAVAFALCLGLAFFYAYAGGLHAPRPHKVPFAVIAPESEYPALAAKLTAAGGEALAPRAVADSATAIKEIKDRSVYGAIEFGDPPHLYIGSASSAVAAQLIVQASTEFAAKQGQQLVTTDVTPLPARDPEGLISFYLVVAAVLGGYIAAVFCATATGSTRFSFRSALQHLGLFLGGAVGFGLGVMVIAGPLMDAVSGNFWALAAVEALIFMTAAAVALGLMAAFGQILGFVCAITLLILLGNSSSGGASPQVFLPGLWRALNSFLPNAAGVNAMTDIAYFPAVSLVRPLLTLAAWLVGGLLVFLVLRPRGVASETQTG